MIVKRVQLLAPCFLFFFLASPVWAQRIFTELEITQLSVINEVAEATFKVVVRNEEETPLAAAWLVFDDGYEVAVGDVPGEGNAASEPATRTFDLSGHPPSLNIVLKATLKYSADGNAVERETQVVLRLDQ